MSRGFLRSAGIGIGGLLGLAAASNGALMNSPYYVTGIAVVLMFVFSLPAVVHELRQVDVWGGVGAR